MTLELQVHDRVQELRREIAEILAATTAKHVSGVEKVKHEKRIQRLEEIHDELFALVAKKEMTLHS
jgi:ribosomal protein L29